MVSIDAVILAGSTNEGKLRDCSGENFEAMVEIAERPMVSYVFDVLKKTPSINKIAVAGPMDQMGPLFGNIDQVFLAPGGETLIDSLMNALEVLNPQGYVLIATCDIPLLTLESVTDFLKRCSKKQADIYYPIIPKDANDRLYPGVKRTYIRFKEGTFTGGNLFLIDPKMVKKCAKKARAFVENRKSPLALARLVGWKFMIRFIFHLVTLKETEITASHIFGLRGAVVISPYPEVGIDVDKPSDLDLVRKEITHRLQF